MFIPEPKALSGRNQLLASLLVSKHLRSLLILTVLLFWVVPMASPRHLAHRLSHGYLSVL